LNEWTIPVIEELLAQGYYESREFDFKQMLPHPKDEDDKARLRGACCAFANSPGGFLVFGVTDNKADSVEQRLVGLPQERDFPEHFGVYPQQCVPAIPWTFKQPALLLTNGHLIHVVQIPRSWSAPHCYRPDPKHPERWRFTKRTDKGTEDMSYEEIRMTFLQYYEKRVTLQLLRAELESIRAEAPAGTLPAPGTNQHLALVEFDLATLQSVLVDVFTVIAERPQLLRALYEIRGACRQVNQLVQRMLATGYLLMGNMEAIHAHHNIRVTELCTRISNQCDIALRELDEILSKP
jgi:hypothetical protein